MLLVSGATKTWRPVIEADPQRFGVLAVPRDGNLLLPFGQWAGDNGAFSGFDEPMFLSMLERHAHARERCLFVTAPDVVADAHATLSLFVEWGPRIRALGYPVALVAQDGLTPDTAPWSGLDALFIGGSTHWKLSAKAAEIALEARRRGAWLHMGRVNTARRLKYAAALGCDSVDGSGWSRFPKSMLERHGHILMSNQLPLVNWL